MSEPKNTRMDIVSGPIFNLKHYIGFVISMGILIVIYYCGKQDFYPSGLTIADTLFFIWTIVGFAIYYNILVILFLFSSYLIVLLLYVPINYVLSNKHKVIQVPGNSEKVMLGLFGILSMLTIIGIPLQNGKDVRPIIATIVLISIFYIITHFNGSSGEHENEDEIKPKNTIESLVIKIVLYVLIYLSPLLFSELSDGAVNATFRNMGVKKDNAYVVFKDDQYKDVFKAYNNGGYLDSYNCESSCTLRNANVLFTGIGQNTKLQIEGSKGKVSFTVPTNNIQLIGDDFN